MRCTHDSSARPGSSRRRVPNRSFIFPSVQLAEDAPLWGRERQSFPPISIHAGPIGKQFPKCFYCRELQPPEWYSRCSPCICEHAHVLETQGGVIRPGREGVVAKEDRGFASMDRSKQRDIASKGGKAAHQKGTAHEWTSEEAREAGRKGGVASHRRQQGQQDQQDPKDAVALDTTG